MATRKIAIETGRGDDGISFRIRDEASGVALAVFRLDREQVYDLNGGSILHVEATMTDHFDRVGKEMQVDQETYHHSMLAGSTYEQMITDAEQAARADRPGWDAYEGRRNNSGGVHVTLRRWR